MIYKKFVLQQNDSNDTYDLVITGISLEHAMRLARQVMDNPYNKDYNTQYNEWKNHCNISKIRKNKE